MTAGAGSKGDFSLDSAVARLASGATLPWWGRIFAGLACAMVMLAVRAVLQEFYSGLTGFMMLLPGVIIASLIGGRLAGFAAMVGSLIGGWLIVVALDGGGSLGSELGRVTTVNFIVVGAFAALVASALRGAIQRLDAAARAVSDAHERKGETEQELRSVVDQVSAGIARVTRDGRVSHANDRFAEILGMDPASVVGMATRDVTHPEDVAATLSLLDGVGSGRGGEIEKRYVRPNGEVVWALTGLRPVADSAGRPNGSIAMVVDITKLKLAEAAIRESEERQRFLLSLGDHLRDLTSPEAIMAEVEQALGRALGVDRVGYGEVNAEAGVVTMTHDWTHGVQSAQGQFLFADFGEALMRDLASGQTIVINDVHEDGRAAASPAFEKIHVRALIRSPLMKGRRLQAFLFVHSATPRVWSEADVDLVEQVAARTWGEIERARAEAGVRESEERFRAIADTAPVLMWVTGQNRVRDFVNQAYVAFAGTSYEEARTKEWRDLLHPDDLDRIVRESAAGEATREPFTMEARFKRADGEYRWLRSISRPRLNSSQDVIGFVGVAFDITEARAAAENLQHINVLLEEKVGEALAEKAQAEADLMRAQRMEAVGQLTGGVAHDFNNLLTVVIGALDIILRSEDPAKTRRLGEAALAAARRGERLTHQLLAFSRRQTLRPESIDLNALIREIRPLLRGAVGEAITLKFRLKRGGATAHVDPGQFEAALLNLVVNARDAMTEGGTVHVETVQCRIGVGEVKELSSGDYIRITVADEGAGMTPDVAVRVFEPFFTTKPTGKGTGLGLSQVYGFARQSGGTVVLDTQPGKGAAIHLYLPRSSAIPAAEPQDEDVGPVVVSRVLLVEDDPSVASVVTEMLADIGLRVSTANSASDALQMLQMEGFDLMLSDVVMPGGMSGVQLARRAAELYPDMPIVLSSGYAGGELETLLDGSPWPFLRKPYSADELRRILSESAA